MKARSPPVIAAQPRPHRPAARLPWHDRPPPRRGPSPWPTSRALDSWMSAAGIDGDFAVVDSAMLNRFFRDYFSQHGQGGTNAQQRNLAAFVQIPTMRARTRSPVHRRPAPLHGGRDQGAGHPARPPRERPRRRRGPARFPGTGQRPRFRHLSPRPPDPRARRLRRTLAGHPSPGSSHRASPHPPTSSPPPPAATSTCRSRSAPRGSTR